ncbi:unnamed protein product [Hapterophycus canaliculatus]
MAGCRRVSYFCTVLFVHLLASKDAKAFLLRPPAYQQNQRVSTGLNAQSQSITHYRTTYHNFRLGKSQGAKGETNQFHVEPDMPAVDEELLEQETFFSLTGSVTKV